jgi:protein-S-isoprenylcysteine O-methyltransferase Ste14
MAANILSPILILLACALYGLVHSWLASLQAKDLARKLLGVNIMERFYRLAYNIFAVFSFLPLLALPVWLPDQPLYRIPFPWLILTLAIQGLAALILFIGLLQTGPLDFAGLRQLIGPVGDRPEELVTGGLYRYVRHPLYTAGIVFIWFSPQMSVNLAALFLGLSAYLVIGALFEERKLVRQYGQAYLDYRRKTPMLIPGMLLPRDDNPQALNAEK